MNKIRIPEGITASEFIRGALASIPSDNIEYISGKGRSARVLTMANGQIWVGILESPEEDIFKKNYVNFSHLHRMEHDRIGEREVLVFTRVNPIDHLEDVYPIRLNLIIRIHDIGKDARPIVEHHIGF